MGTVDPHVLASVEFEVYGKVQGCYFTKYCKEVAETLGIYGWVKNSKKGTIVGKLQGMKVHLDQMFGIMSAILMKNKVECQNLYQIRKTAIHYSAPHVHTYTLGYTTYYALRFFYHQNILRIEWLSTTGSPGCKIEKCELTNWEYLARYDYHNFSIRF